MHLNAGTGLYVAAAASWFLIGSAAGWVLGYIHGQLTARPRPPFRVRWWSHAD